MFYRPSNGMNWFSVHKEVIGDRADLAVWLEKAFKEALANRNVPEGAPDLVFHAVLTITPFEKELAPKVVPNRIEDLGRKLLFR